MSFLSDEEKEELKLERMILHVVDKAQEFEPQLEIAVQQPEFFKTRIIDQAASALHSFAEDSDVRPLLLEMAQGTRTFEEGGQILASKFRRVHVRQSTSGAFFVIELSNGIDGEKLYALIKYDYRPVVELTHDNGQAVLREIIQAFVKEKNAIQKFCLVRYRGGQIETLVSASDRMGDKPDLTDYFESFLGVARTRSIDELSGRLNEAVRSSLQDLRDHLPDRNVSAAVAKAKAALRGRDIVSNDDVVDSVLHAADRPEAEDIRALFEKVTRSKLRHGKLTDVEFRPNPSVLNVQPRRRVRTVEDVRIEFPFEEVNRSVFYERQGDVEMFTIRTKRVVENDTVPVRPR